MTNEKRKDYFKTYYRNNKKRNTDTKRLNYWRKKLASLIQTVPLSAITLDEVNKLDENQLRVECELIEKQ